MEQNQKNNNTEGQGKKQLSPQELQKRKKLIIFPILFLAFAGCMWLIFAPSSSNEPKTDDVSGFNADIPLPKEDGMVGDKMTAYEQEQLRSKQEEKMRSLQDFSFILGEDANKTNDLSLTTDVQASRPSSGNSGYSGNSRPSSIQTSAYAYQDMNRHLGNFYETPRQDKEKDELAKKVEELTAQLEMQQAQQITPEAQMAMIEKAYQMAAKYMNADAGQQPIKQVAPAGAVQGKVQATSVKAVKEQTVSGLQLPISDTELIAQYSQPRNYGFNTAVGTGLLAGKNTILACIHEEQSVMDGQNVRMRLLEPLQVGNIIIPKNNLVTGTSRVQGERLDITITSMEYEGNIIPVELAVYDSDGQKGLYVPSSLETQALNEGVANIGSGLGSSFTVNQNAGAAIVTDLTRGVLQGGSQYLSKKLRTVQVKLKANYQVLLYTKQ